MARFKDCLYSFKSRLPGSNEKSSSTSLRINLGVNDLYMDRYSLYVSGIGRESGCQMPFLFMGLKHNVPGSFLKLKNVRQCHEG
jgi:hypothetical protein